MPTSKSFLPDVNFWLAAAARRHAHHPIAKAWLDAVAEPLLFCRVSQMGFLRLITNPKVMGEDIQSPTQAWETFGKYLADPRILVAKEPIELEQVWREITSGAGFSQNLWTDSYLAAFAKAGGHTVATFDKGFTKLAGGDVLVLDAGAQPKANP